MIAAATRYPACALLVLVAVVAPRAARGDPLPDEAEVRRAGPAALPGLLRRVDDPDPDVRLRARRLAHRVIHDFFTSRAPDGMRLVPGRVTLAAEGVRVEGGFYLAVHEVTLAAFRPFAAKQGWPADPWTDGAGDLPVANVTLEEARAFAREHGSRLPTRAELEHAATGGSRFRYPWGDRFDSARVNSREAGRGRTQSVGGRPAGRSVHGIEDLVGNVAEWTETAAGGEHNRTFLVVGGSFRGHLRRARFVTYRLGPSARLPDVGFRLARSLPAIPLPKGS